MHYNGRTFLSTLTFAALQPFALAGWIPSRQPENVQQHDGGSAQVTLPDLGDLAKYVCPNTNIFGRQASGLSTVPSAQIHDILAMLHAYEQSALAMVGGIAAADGLNSAAAPDLTTPIPVPSLQPVANSVFTKLNRPQECSTHISTLTVALTSTTTATLDPITTTITVAAPSVPDQGITTQAPIPDVLTSAAPTSLQPAASSTLPAIPPLPSSALAYQFNATSQSNIAVYFGQTPATGVTSLETQCADPNVDIVILAFVIQQLDDGAYPELNFGAACGGQTPLMVQKAPGLLYCPELAANITACQRGYGKKVLLSIGGANSNINFSSEKQAKTFATVLWNLFGPVGNVDLQLRPFGMVEVDGFDIGLLSLNAFMIGELTGATRQRRQLPPALAQPRHQLPHALRLLNHETVLPVQRTAMPLPLLGPHSDAAAMRLRLGSVLQ